MKKLCLGILIVSLLLIIGCSSADHVGTINFSLTDNSDGIGKQQNSFKISDEKIYMQSKLTGQTGFYRIIIEQNGKVYDDFNFEVPPDWKGIIKALYLANEEGIYTVKIFTVKDELLVSKGSFQLIKNEDNINSSVQEDESKGFEKVYPNKEEHFNKADSDLLKIVRDGNTGTVISLLEQGARPDVVDEMFITPLMEAAIGGHTEMVKVLLEHGASPNLQAGNSETALMWAVDGGYLEIVNLLLDAGADPNVNGEWYRTSLMSATQNGYTEIVAVLLQAGADTSPQIALDNGDNRTALQMAEDAGYTEIAELIKKADQKNER